MTRKEELIILIKSLRNEIVITSRRIENVSVTFDKSHIEDLKTKTSELEAYIKEGDKLVGIKD